MVVDPRIGRDLVGQELVFLRAGDPADLVGADRHAAVVAVGVGVAAGACHQMEALVAAFTRWHSSVAAAWMQPLWQRSPG